MKVDQIKTDVLDQSTTREEVVAKKVKQLAYFLRKNADTFTKTDFDIDESTVTADVFRINNREVTLMIREIEE